MVFACDLAALDSATKYPSIPTWHVIGERGMLGQATTTSFTAGETVYITEKVDGTNSRVVIAPGGGDYVTGTRDIFLHARGDRLPNQVPVNRVVVDALAEAAEALAKQWQGSDALVVFCEVYGAGIGRNWTDYAAAKDQVGVRMFDTATIDPEVLGWDRERIALWRERGGQRFAPACLDLPVQVGLERVPDLAVVEGDMIPTGREAMEAWMRELLPGTQAGLGDGKGGAEGIVMRTADRSKIVKARFAEYAKTRRQLANRR